LNRFESINYSKVIHVVCTVQYVKSTMSLVDAHLLAASGSDSGAAAAWEPGLLVCIGRLLNVLISSLGPEVSRDPDRIQQVRSIYRPSTSPV
jgi:hypothetical protein